MMKPTIHMNGTSRDELHAAYMDAINAVYVAQERLNKTNPSGRDYYPQGPDAIVTAMREHSVRANCLEAIRRELEELCLATMPTR